MEEKDRRMYWSNFLTGGSDHRLTPNTDEEAVQYIPQHPSAQNLYHLYREMSMSVIDAMTKVLMICAGEK